MALFQAVLVLTAKLLLWLLLWNALCLEFGGVCSSGSSDALDAGKKPLKGLLSRES